MCIREGKVAQENSKVDISIIIITRNRKEELLKTIKSCIAKCVNRSAEFVIIDNGSTDGTFEAVAQVELPNNFLLNYVKSNINLGVAGGRNAGAKRARGNYWFFIDDDAWIDTESESLDGLIDFMEIHPQVAICGVDIYDCVHHVQQNERRMQKNEEIGFVTFRYTGAAHIIRKSAIQREQLYPQKLKYGAEESYAAILAHRDGFEVSFYPKVKVIHKPSQNTRDSAEVNAENIMINMAVIKCLLLKKPMHIIVKVLFFFRAAQLKKFSIGDVIRMNRILKERYLENFDAKEELSGKELGYLIRKYGLFLFI